MRVFFCEPYGLVRRTLRRYVLSSQQTCTGPLGYHNAHGFLDEVQDAQRGDVASGDKWPHDDERWPKACEACGYAFTESDEWQLFHDRLYRRVDTGEALTWREMPVGAVRDCPWLHDVENYKGPDGRTLMCKTPGGDWIIDSRASNCTMPGDNAHKCWVRHGRPEDGTLHVDKNGNTCAAGAGSIAQKTWHGFLHNGQLVVC